MRGFVVGRATNYSGDEVLAPGAAGHALYSDTGSLSSSSSFRATSGFAGIDRAHVATKPLSFVEQGVNAVLTPTVVGATIGRQSTIAAGHV